MTPDILTAARVSSPPDTGQVYSVCLYDEPAFESLFPDRTKESRYIAMLPAINAWIDKTGHKLIIYCDRSMLSSALLVTKAEVWLVESVRYRIPFAQHLWRYYSVSNPALDDCYHHFRGIDNVMCDDQHIVDAFSKSSCDLLHAPYERKKIGEYFPVRGSCSVARDGIAHLRGWLRVPARRQVEPMNQFHCDEFWLRDFYQRHERVLSSFVVMDRRLPIQFFEQFQRRIAHRPAVLFADTRLRGMRCGLNSSSCSH